MLMREKHAFALAHAHTLAQAHAHTCIVLTPSNTLGPLPLSIPGAELTPAAVLIVRPITIFGSQSTHATIAVQSVRHTP